MRFNVRRLVSFAVLIIGFQLVAAGPAGAHTGFESSGPADGAVIGEPVDRIEIRFSGPASPVGDGFVVLDPSGTVREPDVTRSDEDQLVWTLEFDSALAGGPVGVRWTVQAPDAHPIDGSFSFTVTAPLPPSEPADTQSQAEAPVTTEAGAFAPSIDAQTGNGGSLADPAAESAPSLDEFLAEQAASAGYAGQVAAVGRFVAFGAVLLGVGVIVFSASVIGIQRREVAGLLSFVRILGLAIFAGTAVELVGQAAGTGMEWRDALSRSATESTLALPYGAAIGLRALGGLVLFRAAASQTTKVAVPETSMVLRERAVVGADQGSVHGLSDHLAQSEDVKPLARPWWRSSLGVVVAAVLLVLSFVFDGHTTSEGNRWVTGVVDIVHVAAGAVWAGGVVALAGVLWWRHRRRIRLDALGLAVRFSVIAAAALVAAGVAGTVLAVIVLDSPADLWSTPWGRILTLKALAVLAAAGLGAYNHFLVIPWLNDDPADDTRSIWLRNMVTAEALVLGGVIALTAVLVGAAS